MTTYVAYFSDIAVVVRKGFSCTTEELRNEVEIVARSVLRELGFIDKRQKPTIWNFCAYTTVEAAVMNAEAYNADTSNGNIRLTPGEKPVSHRIKRSWPW